MLHTGKLIIAVAVATLALPAVAGSWPQVPSRPAAKAAQFAPVRSATASAPQSRGFVSDGSEAGASLEQYSYFRTEEGPSETIYAARPSIASTATRTAYAGKGAVNGFEYIGGDGGWQLAEHKYVFRNGRVAMSDECDHAIRSAQAVTPADIATTKMPGA